MTMRIQLVGGPTAVIDVGGLRLVTDPTFDPPGSYQRPGGPELVKLAAPALTADEIGRADAVLLSHDQHADNLDKAGRDFLATVPLTLTTPGGAGRPPADGIAARGLAPWQQTVLPRAGRDPVQVTAVPARHGPEGCEPVSGEVTGFVLTAPDLPTIYLSGDNAWLGAVEQVAARFGPVDVAVLFTGAARIAGRFDGALLTLDSAQSAEAARLLGARLAVPVHYAGWRHFTEGGADLRAGFDRAGLAGSCCSRRVRWPTSRTRWPGEHAGGRARRRRAQKSAVVAVMPAGAPGAQIGSHGRWRRFRPAAGSHERR